MEVKCITTSIDKPLLDSINYDLHEYLEIGVHSLFMDFDLSKVIYTFISIMETIYLRHPLNYLK